MPGVRAFQCNSIGLSGTTEVFARCEKRKADTQQGQIEYEEWEARMGIAILGGTNQSEGERAATGHNPFHPDWKDNYASGKGNTKEEAIEALREDVESMREGLWA